MSEEHVPHAVDLHVGAKIRIRRKELGISQERLADTLGLTFQQVQKYERGANRVSASKLYEIAGTLQVELGYFFQGLERSQEGIVSVYDDKESLLEMMTARHGSKLAELFVRLSPSQRLGLLNIAQGIVDMTDPTFHVEDSLAA